MARKSSIKVGDIFGSYTVIREGVKVPNEFDLTKSFSYYLCRCGCGTERLVRGTALTAGKSKSCGECGRIRGYGKDYFCRAYISWKGTINKNKKSIELSQEDYISIVTQNCYYCGDPPTSIHSRLKRRKNLETTVPLSGIDRVDSNKGYLKDNCVPCCRKCNIAKHNHTLGEFFNMVKKIYEKHSLNESGCKS